MSTAPAGSSADAHHDQAYAELPIIAVTVRAMPGDREKSIAAGASDYVAKPVDTDELLTFMERWLTRP